MKVAKHTQIISFVNGFKKTIEGIVDITEGSLCKLTTEDNVEYLINQNNVLYVIRGYSKKDIAPDKPNLSVRKRKKKPISNVNNYF